MDVQLEEPWREVLALAWEAYAAGTIPVGALVVADGGEVVARGRNRIFDDGAGAEIGRTRIAHAEVNALLALRSDRTYERFTLYSALEPCHLCLAAAIAVRVGTVRYAARDPYGGGVRKLLPSEDHRRHPVAVDGPADGVVGDLPELMHVAHFLWRVPEGGVVTFYRRELPQVVAAAAKLPPPDAGATLDDALAALA